MNGVGGAVRICEECQRRRCIAPHTKCSGCRPRVREVRGPRTSEEHARRRYLRRKRAMAAGFPPIFEGVS